LEFAAGNKTAVVHEKLRFERPEARQLGEKVRGGIGSGSERIGGMIALPLRENLMRGRELEIVHFEPAFIDAGLVGERGLSGKDGESEESQREGKMEE
jgi:hypothetical protein